MEDDYEGDDEPSEEEIDDFEEEETTTTQNQTGHEPVRLGMVVKAAKDGRSYWVALNGLDQLTKKVIFYCGQRDATWMRVGLPVKVGMPKEAT